MWLHSLKWTLHLLANHFFYSDASWHLPFFRENVNHRNTAQPRSWKHNIAWNHGSPDAASVFLSSQIWYLHRFRIIFWKLVHHCLLDWGIQSSCHCYPQVSCCCSARWLALKLHRLELHCAKCSYFEGYDIELVKSLTTRISPSITVNASSFLRSAKRFGIWYISLGLFSLKPIPELSNQYNFIGK